MSVKLDVAIINKYTNCIFSDKAHRYNSWDQCFEAFSNNEANAKVLSLHLGFYLASWGMYRGSGGLLQKNYLVHDGAVKILLSKEYRSLKCNSNQDVRKNSINLIMQLKEHLSKHYGEIIFRKGEREKPISCTDTLLSKVILGTLGCMPAYDRYFTTGLKAKGITSLLFGKDSLSELFHFIDENNQQIAQCQTAIKEKTGIYYPVMKIVDMYFWQIGFDNSLNLK